VLPSFWFLYCAPSAGDLWNLKHRGCDDVRLSLSSGGGGRYCLLQIAWSLLARLMKM